MTTGFIAAMLACLLAIATPATRADDTPQTDDAGPHTLMITYRSEARDRPAFRNYLAHEGRVPFDRLVADGALTAYQVLFAPFNGSGTWDAMVVMQFRHFVDTRRWAAIERTQPGGLTAKGLKLARPVDTFSADLTWQNALPDAAALAGGSVFYVIPYEYNSGGQYRKYIDAYLIPQAEGWMKEGVLAGYRIYMNRYPVGRPWDSLFIFQYRDLAAFGRRDEAVARVRETLKADPAWQKLNETKSTIRSESENTVTELVEAR